MRLWVNAFIPRVISGYTNEINQGTNTGKTAVPLPLIARLNPLNVLKPLSAGYLTDQRSFDPNPDANVRMQSLADLSLTAGGWALSGVGAHRTSGTTEVDMSTGETLGFGRAEMDRCSYVGLAPVQIMPGLPFTQFLYVKAAAADPLVSAAADIDYEGAFQITTWPNPVADVIHIEWTLKLDAFPAFEGYAEHNGVVKPLFAIPPDAGRTVADLPGPANRPYQGVVVSPLTIGGHDGDCSGEPE
jgi:hypothetical protein